MIKISLIVILVFLCVINAHNEGQETYRSHNFNFTVNYPTSWGIREHSQGVILISPSVKDESSAFAETVDISVEDINNYSISKEDFFKKGISGILDFSPIQKLKILEEGWAEIGEKKSSFITFTGVLWDFPRKWKQYAIIEASRIYFLLYTAEEEDFYRFLPQAENIILSIRIIKQSK